MGDERASDRLEQLGTDRCIVLLSTSPVGRVGFVVAGRPHVLPVTYASDPDGVVVFRTTSDSLLASVASNPVVFEVDGVDVASHTGWSVCVHGFAREVTDQDDPIARRLLERGVVSWAPGKRDRWIAVVPHEITGRRIPLSPVPSSNGGWTSGVVS